MSNEPRPGYEYCDCCHKYRRDVQAVGRDRDGMPDSPDLCFLCRRRKLACCQRVEVF